MSQKIKETTVQIYGILHGEARYIKANKLRSVICHIYNYLHSQKAYESWNDLFYIVPITHFLWYQNKECRMHESHYNYTSPTQLLREHECNMPDIGSVLISGRGP